MKKKKTVYLNDFIIEKVSSFMNMFNYPNTFGETLEQIISEHEKQQKRIDLLESENLLLKNTFELIDDISVLKKELLVKEGNLVKNIRDINKNEKE